jgi:nucleotide-binding universal stress UspA family protein
MIEPLVDASSRIQTILHPSDFSDDSEVAFAHALKLALAAQGLLSVLHVSKHANDTRWADFPRVRPTLERWGALPPGSDRSAVIDLGIQVKKVISEHDDPVRSAGEFLAIDQTDLIVLAAHRRDGAMRWLHQSVAETLAQKAESMTLFVQHGVRGFVSLEDGSTSLRRFVIPVDTQPDPQRAIDSAVRLATVMDVGEATFTVVYVGEPGDQPEVHLPTRDGWTWALDVRQGELVESILESASDASADVIVMATAGRHGFLDALRGSTTERVMRGADCPLLAVSA